MTEYQLYCFAQSGNAYRAALMLNLIGARWEPIWIDFGATHGMISLETCEQQKTALCQAMPVWY